ncbi:hypothetical protein DAEQUDRAFT_173435 [Daedalea quercina L-15889]|uniref:Uncharacterized protein n=1 Tax=Daedalea quercina L-15889 TaxID=1314783 RepID=A0A165RC13_9APHY|nr:hypothetical protein DAEQUDRAFT_173435 [Daedalea quercina L-15889]
MPASQQQDAPFLARATYVRGLGPRNRIGSLPACKSSAGARTIASPFFWHALSPRHEAPTFHARTAVVVVVVVVATARPRARTGDEEDGRQPRRKECTWVGMTAQVTSCQCWPRREARLPCERASEARSARGLSLIKRPGHAIEPPRQTIMKNSATARWRRTCGAARACREEEENARALSHRLRETAFSQRNYRQQPGRRAANGAFGLLGGGC